jgi:hypothetical protein
MVPFDVSSDELLATPSEIARQIDISRFKMVYSVSALVGAKRCSDHRGKAVCARGIVVYRTGVLGRG